MSMNGNSTLIVMPHVEIYTDGGCEPNPGPGGYGVVLLHPKKRAEASGGFRLVSWHLCALALNSPCLGCRRRGDDLPRRARARRGLISNSVCRYSVRDSSRRHLRFIAPPYRRQGRDWRAAPSAVWRFPVRRRTASPFRWPMWGLRQRGHRRAIVPTIPCHPLPIQMREIHAF